MLGRLALVIHWGMYIWIVWLLVEELNKNGLSRIISDDTLAFTIPFITFTTIYWIVKKRWVFFPWQHIKLEEKN